MFINRSHKSLVKSIYNKWIICLLFYLGSCNAIISNDSLWTYVNEVTSMGERKIFPTQYKVVELNDSLFHSLKTLLNNENNSVKLILPNPDGSMMEFMMKASTTMEKALAEKYPELKTYKAYALDNTTITANLDYTSFGFHAMILNGVDTYFIDPYSNEFSKYYICYYKKHIVKDENDRMQEMQIPEQKHQHKHCKKR